MKNRVIFLDKDGTMIVDRPYNVDPGKIVLEKGAARGLQMLGEAGYHFVVVTNQSGVARGYFKEEALEGVKTRLNELLIENARIPMDGFYYCPHYAGGSIAEYAIQCECRKPRPGMLLKAIRELGIDPSEAWMVGDILNDVEAGKLAGCRTILVNNGHETEWQAGPNRTPDFIAADMEEAAKIILSQTVQPPADSAIEQPAEQ